MVYYNYYYYPSVESYSQGLGQGAHVFIASAAEAHEHDLVWLHGLGQLLCTVDRVGRLQSRYDAFLASQLKEPFQCLPAKSIA